MKNEGQGRTSIRMDYLYGRLSIVSCTFVKISMREFQSLSEQGSMMWESSGESVAKWMMYRRDGKGRDR
jgi:hypothetical protein